MAKSFDPSAMGVLIVSERDNGMHAIIDGQHRFEAGKKIGIEWFDCACQKFDYKKEADVFYKTNVERGIVRSTLQFKASLEAGHDKSVDIKSIVDANGFRIEFVKASKSKNMIGCVDKLLKAHNIGANHLELVLSTLRKAYDGDKKSLTNHFIEGLSIFLKNYITKIDYNRFIKLLKTTPIDTLILDAKRMKSFNGGRLGTCIENSIFNLYNKSLRNKIEPYQDRRSQSVDGESDES
jgi:hypothetical protein